MSDGIAEMNKAKTYTHTDGRIYLAVGCEKIGLCHGCSIYEAQEYVDHPACEVCDDTIIYKLQSPLDKASAALAEAGTPLVADREEVKEYDTGATRGGGKKPSHMAYNSPLADVCFGEYMMKHEEQSDGEKRDPGNWKLGMPLNDYAESHERHSIDFRLILDGFPARDNATLKDTLCAMRFNINGYLHELIKAELKEKS